MLFAVAVPATTVHRTSDPDGQAHHARTRHRARHAGRGHRARAVPQRGRRLRPRRSPPSPTPMAAAPRRCSKVRPSPPAATGSCSRPARISRPRACRSPIRRSSTRSCSISALPMPTRTTTCRCSSRRGAIRPIAAAEVLRMEAYAGEWLQLLIRWIHLITGIAWIGASFYFVWLDNSLLPPQGERRCGQRRRRRIVGGARWRLLPRAEAARRAFDPARAAALVQMGSVLDVDQRLCAAGRAVLRPRRRLSRRQGGGRHRARRGGRHQRRAAGGGLGVLRPALQAARARTRGAARGHHDRIRRRARLGACPRLLAGARCTCRSARCSAR